MDSRGSSPHAYHKSPSCGAPRPVGMDYALGMQDPMGERIDALRSEARGLVLELQAAMRRSQDAIAAHDLGRATEAFRNVAALSTQLERCREELRTLQVASSLGSPC